MKFKLHGFTVNLGDRVWSYVDGWGTVSELMSSEYSLGVVFDSDSDASLWFTSEGFQLIGDLNPTLFWNELPIHIDAVTKVEKIITLVFFREGDAQPTPLKIAESDLAETLVKIVNDGYTVRKVNTDGTS